MKKILSTIIISVLLLSCKHNNSENVKPETNKKTESEKIVYKKLIENEKLEEFSVSLLKSIVGDDVKIELLKNGNVEPFIYILGNLGYLEISKVKSTNEIVSFIDFNFDGEKEIVIKNDNGINLYDRKNGKSKNLFNEENNYPSKGKTNYIYTFRGEYEINEKEKTITITGNSDSSIGIETTYKGDGTGKLWLINRNEWKVKEME